jgi:hypothetical protein
MARICSVICTSHSPYLFADIDEWEIGRARRVESGAIAASVPVETRDENAAKYERCLRAFARLREELERARPDAIVIFGDDQREQFEFSGFPAFGIFVGDQFEGYRISPNVGLPVGRPRERRPKTPEHWVQVSGRPDLARALMVDLVKQRFDLAFSVEVANAQEGMGHAFMRPLHVLTPEMNVPAIPIYINCYYGPQPTGARCFELGAAVRQAIEASPLDLRVAVIGSGGLWHTPNSPQSILNEDFDGAMLAAVRSGDARAMGDAFDAFTPAYDPADPKSVEIASGGTGMVLGYGLGTGETRNWIAAAGVADGKPGTIVDYVPVYASPIGLGFAYWRFDERVLYIPSSSRTFA